MGTRYTLLVARATLASGGLVTQSVSYLPFPHIDNEDEHYDHANHDDNHNEHYGHDNQHVTTIMMTMTTTMLTTMMMTMMNFLS